VNGSSGPDRLTVTVVIPAYNPGRYLIAAIESALLQEPAPLEVIIVDDGSTVPVVVTDRSGVRVVRQPNAGPSAARNRGIREARGELIAFLDADDVWYPGKLAAQLARIRPGVGLCSCDFDVIDFEGTRPGWGGHGGDYRQLLRGNSICTSTVLARRSVLVEAGGFDERLRRSEDWAMWLDIARQSELEHVGQLFVGYRQHDVNASGDYRQMWWGAVHVLWRHRGPGAAAGLRRVGQVYGAQAFDAFRHTRRTSHLLWATALWPAYVLRQIGRRTRHHRERFMRPSA
jgi:glycosyltransferase involved in cell wall biosynthesis